MHWVSIRYLWHTGNMGPRSPPPISGGRHGFPVSIGSPVGIGGAGDTPHGLSNLHRETGADGCLGKLQAE